MFNIILRVYSLVCDYIWLIKENFYQRSDLNKWKYIWIELNKMFNINVETSPSSTYKVEKISRKNRKKEKENLKINIH